MSTEIFWGPGSRKNLMGPSSRTPLEYFEVAPRHFGLPVPGPGVLPVDVPGPESDFSSMPTLLSFDNYNLLIDVLIKIT